MLSSSLIDQHLSMLCFSRKCKDFFFFGPSILTEGVLVTQLSKKMKISDELCELRKILVS
jgi:hypothetical protein